MRGAVGQYFLRGQGGLSVIDAVSARFGQLPEEADKMQRDDMLAKVEAAYQARRTGDFARLAEIVARDAVFTYAGDQSLLAGVPGAGELNVHQAARQLFESIELR